jgi:hypothetical protein
MADALCRMVGVCTGQATAAHASRIVWNLAGMTLSGHRVKAEGIGTYRSNRACYARLVRHTGHPHFGMRRENRQANALRIKLFARGLDGLSWRLICRDISGFAHPHDHST